MTDNGDVNARQAYIRAFVDALEVDEKTTRFIGNKDVLQGTRMFAVVFPNGGNLALPRGIEPLFQP
jgi:hypothetical protein